MTVRIRLQIVVLLGLIAAGTPLQDRTIQPATVPTTQPASRQDAIASAHRMILAFLRGDVADFRSRANPRLNTQHRDSTLRQLAQLIREEHGGLIAFGEAAIRYDAKDPSLSVVTVPTFMDRQALAFVAVVTSGGGIAGFRIVSFTPRGRAVPQPDYVNPSAFREVPVEAGGRVFTLSVPYGDRPFPVILLLGMPEPHNRNQSLGTTHILRDLAHGLASCGIAAVRLDEVSTGPDGAELPQAPSQEAAAALLAMLRDRPDVDPGRLFILGHGFGGLLAARVTAAEAGARRPVAGVVILATPARPLMDAVLGHVEALIRLDGRIAHEEEDVLDEAMATRNAVTGRAGLHSGGRKLGTDLEQWRTLAAFQPAEDVLEGLKAHTGLRALVVLGGRDLLATSVDFAIWQEQLAVSPQAVVQFRPALDHALDAGTGMSRVDDYTRPRPVSGELVLDIAEWLSPGSTTRPAASPAAASS